MESLVNLRADLALYCHQPLDVAGRITQSDAKNFFDSKSYADFKKLRDHEYRMQSAVIDRLNGVIEALGVIAKQRR